MTGPKKMPLVGYIMSPNCDFVMNVSVSALVVDKHRLERKAIQYSMLVRNLCPGYCTGDRPMAKYGRGARELHVTAWQAGTPS